MTVSASVRGRRAPAARMTRTAARPTASAQGPGPARPRETGPATDGRDGCPAMGSASEIADGNRCHPRARGCVPPTPATRAGVVAMQIESAGAALPNPRSRSCASPGARWR
jgi:hypothetical protein